MPQHNVDPNKKDEEQIKAEVKRDIIIVSTATLTAMILHITGMLNKLYTSDFWIQWFS